MKPLVEQALLASRVLIIRGSNQIVMTTLPNDCRVYPKCVIGKAGKQMSSDKLYQMVGLDVVICARLHQVVRGEASIDDFEAWLVEHSWDHHSRLADALTLVFAERNVLGTHALLDELVAAASASTSKIKPVPV